jgi:hypothetical protein
VTQLRLRGLQVLYKWPAASGTLDLSPRNVNEKGLLRSLKNLPVEGQRKSTTSTISKRTVESARAGQKMIASPDFHYAVNGKPH